MLRLLLVRHAETEHNTQARCQGQSDPPLSAVGRRQAAALAARLAQEKIHHVYASDLRRATETAVAIAAAHNLPVHTDPRLREMAFGEWEGLTWAEIGERYPQEWAAWQADPLGVAPPGGETLAQVTLRVQSALGSIAERHPDQCVALVSHGGPLRVLLCLALDLPPQAHWRFHVESASISELRMCAGDVSLLRLNDVAHLRQPACGSERAELILVLGGARSGKSDFARRLAHDLGGDRVLFIATAEAGDEEMRRRIERHRRERPAEWHTLEVQRDVGAAIRDHLGESRVVLLDCLSLLVARLLLEAQDVFAGEVEAQVVAEVERLVASVSETAAHLIVVSNEVGCGLVPDHPLGRAYRDLLGRANQMLAHSADRVYVLMAGIPMVLKGSPIRDMLARASHAGDNLSPLR